MNRRAEAGSLAHDALWNALATVARMTSSFFSTVLVARVLGPSAIGRVAYTLWLLSMVDTVVGISLPISLSRFVAELRGQGRVNEVPTLVRWLRLRFGALALGGALTVGVLGWATERRLSSCAIVVGVFTAQSVSSFYLAYLTGMQQFRRLASIQLLATGMQLVAVGFGSLHFGESGALLGYAVGALPQAMLGTLLLLRRPVALSAQAWADGRRVWRFAFAAWSAAIVGAIVFSRTEVAFIRNFRGDDSVAAFVIAISICQLAIEGPFGLFVGAFLPHFSSLTGSGDLDRARHVYGRATRLIGSALLPICFITAGLTPALIPLIYGGKYSAVVPLAVIATVFGAARAFVPVATPLLYALERVAAITYTNLVAALFTVLLGGFCTWAWGAAGAVWSRALVQSGLCVFLLWYVARRIDFPMPLSSLLRTAVAAGVAGATALFMTAAGGPSSVVVALPAATLLFLGMVWLLKSFTRDDLRDLRGVLFERSPDDTRSDETRCLMKSERL